MKSITVALLLFLFRCVLSQQPCYFPNGEEAPNNYRACRSNQTSFNTCCSAAYSCLENGLCKSGTGRARPTASIARGACTDQNWSGCQPICLSQETDSSVYVKKCNDGKYCCRTVESYDCCLWEDFRFLLQERRKPVAAIAGGTVGGVVGVATLAGLGWWLWKRKKAARVTAEKSSADNKSSPGSQMAEPSGAEVDAGPDSVLVESDARDTQPTRIHELSV